MRVFSSPVAQSICAAALFAVSASPAFADGRIVAAHDEWTLSDSGFAEPSDPDVFAFNVVAFLTGKLSADILIYSNSFGLTQPMLSAAITGFGHSVTISTATPFTVENLSIFDAVFIGGIDFDDQVLIDYVETGGGVYICAGTESGSDTANNTFMNHFGLQFNGLNGLSGHREINLHIPLFDGVDHLFENNGSTITDLNPLDDAHILVTHSDGAGLYAIYDPATCPTAFTDIDEDGDTDGADLGLLLAAWGDCQSSCCPADINEDDAVDGADLGLLLAEWTG
jgi:hypothetical protein